MGEYTTYDFGGIRTALLCELALNFAFQSEPTILFIIKRRISMEFTSVYHFILEEGIDWGEAQLGAFHFHHK